MAVLVALAIPLPRRTGHVTAQIQFTGQGDRAVVTATLTPPSAADHYRWFQVLAWQGEADPGIPAPEVPAIAKTVAFGNEQQFLLREQTGSGDWFAGLIEVLMVGIATLWASALVVAATRIYRRAPLKSVNPAHRSGADKQTPIRERSDAP